MLDVKKESKRRQWCCFLIRNKMPITQHEHSIQYSRCETVQDLTAAQQSLIESAFQASDLAYAPYSKFNVGAAAKLKSGAVVTASNKENASFPAGICAERNLLNYISDHFPTDEIRSLAVTVNPLEFEVGEPISPCGVCRQVMCEVEKNQSTPFEILLKGTTGEVLIFDSASSLLPFHFYLKELKR